MSRETTTWFSTVATNIFLFVSPLIVTIFLMIMVAPDLLDPKNYTFRNYNWITTWIAAAATSFDFLGQQKS
ncbi:hypothetical protein DERP_003099 [Dermatophagoides pteronyssinus]|uniref:Uncharacterized protein n=1 Tax=Dermatophagoides pteronyssinus TaxID=6956 RepID=A0ABQ8JII5_DERPT|nr:hypothetical protein DERP_003099 [Dermatophagoides pteronyssinus]